MTGAGQPINGEWGKAIGMHGGAIACGVIGSLTCPPIAILGGIGFGIWSIVDAVKNAKP